MRSGVLFNSPGSDVSPDSMTNEQQILDAPHRSSESVGMVRYSESVPRFLGNQALRRLVLGHGIAIERMMQASVFHFVDKFSDCPEPLSPCVSGTNRPPQTLQTDNPSIP
jgi:hypothetical protein